VSSRRYIDEDEDYDAEGSRNSVERVLVGLGIAAAAGAAFVIGTRLVTGGNPGPFNSDAPRSTARRKADRMGETAARTVTINRPAQELYDFWRNFENLPQFMDNIRSVTTLDTLRSHWVIEAPAGTAIEFDSRITSEVPGQLIAWESEEGASVPNRGKVEFIEAAPGRGTMVRATISYDPPGGPLGKIVAKIFQREPNVQARRDLRRFKQLMETGEVTSSAGPSARPGELPTKQYL